ncbi:MAG: carbohydrate-binding protein [Bacillota bacterium]|nr:carbohydrate-binding protein [Bacillota bacterium]HOB92354.1 carbohydrate-binding protein [Bacillota bacterium]HPZ55461.1 carbohydrate-binding protein [Bacillota bacterium]HQD18876.1 carbohydrate-binding protein [Bacillota bacterium]
MWTTKTAVVARATGVHDLFLVFRGNEAELLKFDYWQFEPAE